VKKGRIIEERDPNKKRIQAKNTGPPTPRKSPQIDNKRMFTTGGHANPLICHGSVAIGVACEVVGGEFVDADCCAVGEGAPLLLVECSGAERSEAKRRRAEERRASGEESRAEEYTRAEERREEKRRAEHGVGSEGERGGGRERGRERGRGNLKWSKKQNR
jgi:hypothetical protein